MQAIRTRYVGPTNTRGSRITAKCEAGSVSVPYDDALNSEQNHRAACDKLRAKLGWTTPHYGAMTHGVFDGDYYWTFDGGRLRALRDLVNVRRAGKLTGNPYCVPEFIEALRTIGAAFDYHGAPMEAPTRDEEIAQWQARNI